MADGSLRFNFPLPQKSQLRPGEIIVDLFAGGGGASEGLKQALGIDRTANGTPISVSAAVRMVGNSVSPPPIAALARANLDKVRALRRVAA